MTKKSVALLAMATLVLGLSACGAKEEVSEVTSVTEKVQETNTSIADKIDNINVDEKTDLSNLPEIEVPDVPEVVEEAEEKEAGEVVAMTEEEFDNAIKESEDSASIEWKEHFASEEEMHMQVLRNYVRELAENDITLRDITLAEYFGENYIKIPDADNTDTIGEYSDAENAYAWYKMDRAMSKTLDPQKYEGQKELTPSEFHKNKELTQEWLNP